jgi:hypothetical protein
MLAIVESFQASVFTILIAVWIHCTICSIPISLQCCRSASEVLYMLESRKKFRLLFTAMPVYIVYLARQCHSLIGIKIVSIWTMDSRVRYLFWNFLGKNFGSFWFSLHLVVIYRSGSRKWCRSDWIWIHNTGFYAFCYSHLWIYDLFKRSLLLMRANPLRGQVGGGWALGI